MNGLTTLNSLFDDFFGYDQLPTILHNSGAMPKVDIKEENDGYTLEMELPGRSEKDINIIVEQNQLKISSEKEEVKEEKETKAEKKEKFLLRERHFSNFERRFNLPQDIDSQNIKANFKNGVLTVNLGKKEIASPTKIAIDVA